MRIIAGDYKGRVLKTPKDDKIRPTAGKVKEALFSMIAFYVEDAVVVDLFAGAGGLGLEALSRGAKVCYFGGNQAECINLVKSNIDICGAGEKSRIIAGDFVKALSNIPEKADIIILDPPYGGGFMDACFKNIAELALLNDDGVIAAEHGALEILPDIFYGFRKIKGKKYGKIRLSIYS